MKIKIPYRLLLMATLIIGTISCESYLDKTKEENLTKEVIFTEIKNVQGVVEDIYQCMVNVVSINSNNVFNFGDEFAIYPSSNDWAKFIYNGDYNKWRTAGYGPFKSTNTVSNNGATNGYLGRGYWEHGWLGIRKSNLVLENLDMATIPYIENGVIDETPTLLEDQKKLIKGQALFFRGYFHFEIIRAWGGMPYLDKVEDSNKFDYTRLSYQESADRIAQDLEEAAKLLTDRWDTTVIGKAYGKTSTFGMITRGAAYGILGKNYLYAASPLMNGVSTGNYTYDLPLCKKAVKALYEVIRSNSYEIIPFDPILPKLPPPSVNPNLNTYWRNYFNFQQGGGFGTKEVILQTTMNGQTGGWHQVWDLTSLQGAYSAVASPTQNYVECFGMANGKPLMDPTSGYADTDPWVKRDPRFKAFIVTDGDTVDRGAAQIAAGVGIASLSNSGAWKQTGITGYMWRKFRPGWYGGKQSVPSGTYANRIHYACPILRLADVYLMYAEAVNEAYGPNVAPLDITDYDGNPITLTAMQAVKKVRDRVGVQIPAPPLPYFTLDGVSHEGQDGMREAIRDERAVELCFEGHRWYDLRRWYVCTEKRYKEVYVLNYDRSATLPVKPVNAQRVMLVEKNFSERNYWLPLDNTEVNVNEGYQQNPGW